MNDEIKVEVSVESVKYFKNSWGIIVCSVDSVEKGEFKKGDEIVLKGEMPTPKPGNTYNVTAKYEIDKHYGEQYSIISIATAFDFSASNDVAKRKFLLSIFTPKQVEAMYEVTDDPFTALRDKDAATMVKVKGCQLKTAALWMTRFNAHYDKAKLYVELDKYHLTTNMMDRLLTQYKTADMVIEKITTNPYILCTEVSGIGWKKADQIALAGGLKEDDPKRIGSFIKFYLNMKGDEGYSWLTADQLLTAILENLGEEISDAKIGEGIDSIRKDLWWSEKKDKIGLKYFHDIEERVAKELLRLRDVKSDFDYEGWEKKIKKLEEQQGWEYTDQQLDGIKAGLENNVVLIQGFSGTGKTSLVSGILAALGKKYKFVQTSLSGRAASRMSEVTGEEGYTIHRLLGFPKGQPENQGFVYHKGSPLQYDIVILDEISMVDIKLFYFLLRAIKDGSKLIMLGDSGQLESIGAGNIAYDLKHSDEIKSIELTKIQRQAQKSAIITESCKVRYGQQIIVKDWVGEETRGALSDLHLLCYSDASNTYYKLMQRFSICASKPNFNILECQMILPVKKRGSASTKLLNNTLQDVYNPPSSMKKEVKIFSDGQQYIIREGDKVKNTKNNYHTSPNIYNGNMGIVKQIGFDYNTNEEFMIINFVGIGRVKIGHKDFKDIELGYAITVHSSQGSQWDTVILGIDYSSYALLTRELIYTAMTRAKKECFLIAQNSALRMAISREGVNTKQTFLWQCLHDVAHPKLIF